MPKTISGVAFTHDDGLAVFVNFDVIFGEQGDAIVVAELSDGDEGARLEALEDVADFGRCGKFGCEGDNGAFRGLNILTVGDLDGRA
jgi:hypothetical protein